MLLYSFHMDSPLQELGHSMPFQSTLHALTSNPLVWLLIIKKGCLLYPSKGLNMVQVLLRAHGWQTVVIRQAWLDKEVKLLQQRQLSSFSWIKSVFKKESAIMIFHDNFDLMNLFLYLYVLSSHTFLFVSQNFHFLVCQCVGHHLSSLGDVISRENHRMIIMIITTTMTTPKKPRHTFGLVFS